MPKLKADSISDSSGVIAAGESHISDAHWQKMKGKSEKDLLKKLKISKDKRKKATK